MRFTHMDGMVSVLSARDVAFTSSDRNVTPSSHCESTTLAINN